MVDLCTFLICSALLLAEVLSNEKEYLVPSEVLNSNSSTGARHNFKSPARITAIETGSPSLISLNDSPALTRDAPYVNDARLKIVVFMEADMVNQVIDPLMWKVNRITVGHHVPTLGISNMLIENVVRPSAN